MGESGEYRYYIDRQDDGSDIYTKNDLQSDWIYLPGNGVLDKVQGQEAGGNIVDAGDVLMMIFSGFIGFGIPILFWLGTLVFGIVMLRRGGGRPERFFITGAALSLFGMLLRIPIVYHPIWLHDRDYGRDTMSSIIFGAGLFINIISALGVMGFIYAFWLKFKNRQTEPVVPTEAES